MSSTNSGEPTRMDYLTLRLDTSLKDALVDAARAEHRPLSNFCRLLLEFAFNEYRQAGSIRDLLSAGRERTLVKEG